MCSTRIYYLFTCSICRTEVKPNTHSECNGCRSLFRFWFIFANGFHIVVLFFLPSSCYVPVDKKKTAIEVTLNAESSMNLICYRFPTSTFCDRHHRWRVCANVSTKSLLPFFVDCQSFLSSAQCFPSIGLPYTADGWCGNADECGVQSVSRRNLIIRSPKPVSSGFDFALPRLNRKPPLNKSNKKRKENTQTPTLTLTYQNTK